MDKFKTAFLKEIKKMYSETPVKSKDMGKIMGALKSDFAGRIDMGKAGAVVKRHLCAAKAG